VSDYYGTAPEGKRVEYHSKVETDPLQEARRMSEKRVAIRILHDHVNYGGEERALARAYLALAQRVEDAERLCTEANQRTLEAYNQHSDAEQENERLREYIRVHRAGSGYTGAESGAFLDKLARQALRQEEKR
jgi:hypothetical protein